MKLTDDQKTAKALLETCRGRMMGREIAICEIMLEGELEEKWDEWRASGRDDHEYDELRYIETRFASLKIEFAREVDQWERKKMGLKT